MYMYMYMWTFCTCVHVCYMYNVYTCRWISEHVHMYIKLARNHLNAQEMIFDHYLYKREVSSAGPTEKLANKQGYHSSYHAEWMREREGGGRGRGKGDKGRMYTCIHVRTTHVHVCTCSTPSSTEHVSEKEGMAKRASMGFQGLSKGTNSTEYPCPSLASS